VAESESLPLMYPPVLILVEYQYKPYFCISNVT